jgi:glycerate-2-kinase
VKQTNLVLLDNDTALQAAAKKATSLGFCVEIADDIVEQPVESGCNLSLARLSQLLTANREQPVCLISGGEFKCPVRGNGRGGRNQETVLHFAIKLERSFSGTSIVALSCGTDGVDGNSPAAGAIADTGTMARASNASLDAAAYLANSDSYSFFKDLGDVILTGPTGTNVRDLRILLAN